MPVVIYPVGIDPSDEARRRQRRVSSLRGKQAGNTSPQQLSTYTEWRCWAEFHCDCPRHPNSPPPEEFLHCPVPQSAERLTDDLPVSSYNMPATSPKDLVERMRLGGCYRPWVDKNYHASCLHWAAVKGDCKFVQRVVEAQPKSVFCKDSQGNTPLMLASAASPTACFCEEPREMCIVEAVITHCPSELRGDLVRLENDDGLTALHFAALNGRMDIVQILLQHGAHPDAASVTGGEEDKDCELAEDKKCGVAEDKTCGMTEDKNRRTAVTEDKEYGVTPLHLAIISRKQGAAQCVRLLLQAGANPEAEILVLAEAYPRWGNLKIECDCGGCWSRTLMAVVPPGHVHQKPYIPFGSALMLAVFMQDVEKVSVLLKECQQVNINYRDWEGWSPVLYATAAVSSKIMGMLIRHQADLNVCYDIAVSNRGPVSTVVHVLLSHSLNQQQNGSILSCLWCEAVLHVTEQRLQQAVEMILDSNRFRINSKNLVGFTPLLIAAQKGYVRCCRSLLQHGADPLVRSDIGETPLYFACKLKQKDLRDELVHLLLQQGVAHHVLRKYGGASHNWDSHLSPIRIIFDNVDCSSLVKLYRAGAIGSETLRRMKLAHPKSVEFGQAITHLLGSLQSLSDRCLHVLSTTVGVGSPVMRKSRLENRVVQTVQQWPGYGETEDNEVAHKPVLAIVQQRMKVLNLI